MQRGSAHSPEHDQATDRDRPDNRRAVECLSPVARIVGGILHLIAAIVSACDDDTPAGGPFGWVR